MSAPYSNGRSRIGVATVLSTISGTPCLWASMRERFEVADVAGRISHALAKERAGVVIDQLLHRLRMIALGKSNADPELRQDVREQRMRRAIELRDGNDVLAVARYVQHRVVQSGLPAADCERADAPFERSDAPFEYVASRIADSAVAIALDLEVEQGSTVLGAVEGIGNRLIDRHRDRPGRRIDLVPAVDCKRFVSQILLRSSQMLIERAATMFMDGSQKVR